MICLLFLLQFFHVTDVFFIVFLYYDDTLTYFDFPFVSIDYTFTLIFEHFFKISRYFNKADANESTVILGVEQ